MWERFFNWQSDMDWTWGPFLPLRPARETDLQPWVWVRLFTVFSLAGLVLIGLVGAACALGPRLAAQQHWAVPLGLAETLGTLSAMAADPTLRLLLIGLGLSLPLLFFAACYPFHVAWNRRAARLRQELPSDTTAASAEVWPPAPNNSPL